MDDARLVGTELQGAQDEIQSASNGARLFQQSTDLTGQGRMQIDDRNGRYDSSGPGATFTRTEIDLAS